LAPLAVTVLGIATAIVVVIVGFRQLSQQGSKTAAERARLVASTLAARLSAMPERSRAAELDQAVQRSGQDLLLVRGNGTVLAGTGELAQQPETLSRCLSMGHGEIRAGNGLARFHAMALPAPDRDVSIVALIPVPDAPRAQRSLLVSVAALAWLLVGVAALVAFAIARDVRSDVQYLTERINDMAREGSEPAGKMIPVRSTDQIGLLTVAFDGLVERFTAAEHAYRQDLAGALAYDRDRSAFLAALSHELRTPLNAILGFTEVLLSEVDGPLSDDSRENLEVVRGSGQHLRDLIDDILELSALESGELDLSRGPVDVVSVAEEVVREARVNVQNKPLEIELDAEPTEVWGDARRIRQILGNVLGNAVKFTTEGKVELSIAPDSESWTLIRVRDTGPGIPEEDQAAIFEEYQQSGDLATRRAGSGLGLAITRRLVQMHEGVIELESTLGKGSCFSIWLPRRELMPRDSRAPGSEGEHA